MPQVELLLDSGPTGNREYDSRLGRYQVTTLGKVFTVHTHVPLSPSSKFGTGQRAVTLYSWEGNRRSGVAPAMHHRLRGLSTYGLNGTHLHSRRGMAPFFTGRKAESV